MENIELRDLNKLGSSSVQLVNKYSKITKLIKITSKTTEAGNKARDHLANERTILAYARTSLNLFLLGLVIVQLTKYSILEPISSLGDLSKYNQIDNVALLIILKDLDVIHHYFRPIGIIVFSLGLLILFFGATRYSRICQLLFSNNDQFEEGSLFSMILFLIMAVICILSFIMILLL